MRHSVRCWCKKAGANGEGKGGDNNVHLKHWLQEGRKQLDEAREARDIAALTSLQEQIESVRQALIGQIAMLLDEAGDAPAAGGCVRQLMFLDRLAEEVDFAEQDLSGV